MKPLLTFSCCRRKPLLTNDARRERLARSIDSACLGEGFLLNAFVTNQYAPLLSKSDLAAALGYLKEKEQQAVNLTLLANPDSFESGV